MTKHVYRDSYGKASRIARASSSKECSTLPAMNCTEYSTEQRMSWPVKNSNDDKSDWLNLKQT